MTDHDAREALREKIARIINPRAWKRREQFQATIDGTADRYPDDPEKRAMYVRSATRRVDVVVQESLAMADAILASLPAPQPPAPGGEGLDELVAMLSAAVPNELGGGTFDHSPEEIGTHVMEHYRSILAALANHSPDAGGVGEVEITYEVWEADMLVASSTDEADASHYHAVYSQDGAVRLVKAVTTRTEIRPGLRAGEE